MASHTYCSTGLPELSDSIAWMPLAIDKRGTFPHPQKPPPCLHREMSLPLGQLGDGCHWSCSSWCSCRRCRRCRKSRSSSRHRRRRRSSSPPPWSSWLTVAVGWRERFCRPWPAAPSDLHLLPCPSVLVHRRAVLASYRSDRAQNSFRLQ